MQNIVPILKRLSSSRDKFLATIDSVPEARWFERPRPDAWSAAEVVAHVTMVERAVNKNLNRLLKSPPVELPLYKRLHFPFWIARFRILKFKSPIPLKAELVSEKDKLVESLGSMRKATTDLLEANRSRELSAYRSPHPFLGSLNFYDWHELLASHEDRHRKQIRVIVESFHL